MARSLASTLTRVRGVAAGHARDPRQATGVTLVRFDRPTPVVVDVRGGASCTYDTASLSLDATFGRRWAVFFSGGSVFGLDAGRGIREVILRSGGGHAVFGRSRKVAPISGATLYDLSDRSGRDPDYSALGAAAARTASRRPVPEGRVGAGSGSRVGKYLGPGRSEWGGVGSAAASVGRGSVGALVVLNSVGAIRDPETGEWIAGARGADGRVIPPTSAASADGSALGTTLALVATDLDLGDDRRWLQRVATLAHSGLARVVVPTHTATDGDVLFAASTARVRPPNRTTLSRFADKLGTVAAELVVESARRAVSAVRRSAGDAGSSPSARG